MIPLKTTLGAFLAIQLLGAVPAVASSHMDAPLISLDDPANTTDVYAFKSKTEGVNYLTTALSVYPFEEPGVGPNNYGFDLENFGVPPDVWVKNSPADDAKGMDKELNVAIDEAMRMLKNPS